MFRARKGSVVAIFPRNDTHFIICVDLIRLSARAEEDETISLTWSRPPFFKHASEATLKTVTYWNSAHQPPLAPVFSERRTFLPMPWYLSHVFACVNFRNPKSSLWCVSCSRPPLNISGIDFEICIVFCIVNHFPVLPNSPTRIRIVTSLGFAAVDFGTVDVLKTLGIESAGPMTLIAWCSGERNSPWGCCKSRIR